MTTLAPSEENDDAPTIHEVRGYRAYDGDPYGLLDRLLNHKREQGGTLALATGIQGSGKTTFLVGLASAFVEQGETVIWRGRSLDAWHAFPGDVKIWVQEDYPLVFGRVGYHDDSTFEPWTDLPTHSFKDGPDLIKRAERGCLNVVYDRPTRLVYNEKREEWAVEPTRFWGRLVDQLRKRPDARWIALFMDEMHEVWHDRPEGEDYKHQAEVRDAFADFRKSFCSFIGASHEPDEIDYRILAKLQFHIYARGSTPKRKSAVWPAATRTLKPGEVILDSLYYTKVAYPKIDKPPYQVMTRVLGEDDIPASVSTTAPEASDSTIEVTRKDDSEEYHQTEDKTGGGITSEARTRAHTRARTHNTRGAGFAILDTRDQPLPEPAEESWATRAD